MKNFGEVEMVNETLTASQPVGKWLEGQGFAGPGGAARNPVDGAQFISRKGRFAFIRCSSHMREESSVAADAVFSPTLPTKGNEMLKLVKTTLLSGALVALTAHPAPAQFFSPAVRCPASGGQMVYGKCQVPAKPEAKPAETPAQPGPRTGAQPGRGQQGATQPESAQQGSGQGRGQGGAPGNVPQGNTQPQGSRGQGQQQGGVQQPPPQQATQPPGNGRNDRQVQQPDRGPGNDRNGQRDNNQFGNDRNNNNFGQRDNRQFGNDRNNSVGRNFDQAEFNRRYYGRYGNDPNNFDRNRQRYRAQQQWRERYPHDYVYADDSFYRDCRANNEVGGAIVGAILGGILGNAASNGQGGATLAGMILGGAGGATIARNLDCEDRTYVYRAYYDGFERGRRQTSYPWRNDRTGHYGTLFVSDYYRDQDNYRCATYTQTIYVRGTPQIARGHACRQEDATWAFVD